MSVDVTVKGISAFLSDVWGTSVDLSEVSAASAGARRRNVLFTAHRGGEAIPLVATIIHDAGLQIMSVETEAATLKLAEDAGVAVAHVHAICMDPAYVGGPFFVTSQIAGETIPRQVLRLVEATPGLGPKLARDIGASFAKLHAVDPATAHPLLARPQFGATNAIDAALRHVRAQIDMLLQPSPVFELTYAWLVANQPAPGERLSVVHRDCRNGNIIVGPDGLRAILDWEVAHLGEPMEDLAWVCVRMWRFRNDTLEVGGFASRDDLRAGYEEAGGSWSDASFFWWKVHATLRWGLGLAGQGRAHLDGTFSSIVMAGSGRRVGELEYDCLMLLRSEFAELREPMELKDKVAVVTGAATGIGRGLAVAFAREGARAVVVADINGARAQESADAINADGGTALGVTTDVSNQDSVTALVHQAEEAFGPVDLFCANAGVLVMGGVHAPDEEWRRAFDINVMSHVYAARAVLPGMVARGEGYLLHTASAAGLLTQLGAAPYSMSKHAAVSIAEWIAVTYGDVGIKVSCLCPQAVRTEIAAFLGAPAPAKNEPSGQGDVSHASNDGVLEPEDVARVVVAGLRDERFLILPHPQVEQYEQRRANDRDRWLRGMRKQQRLIGLPSK